MKKTKNKNRSTRIGELIANWSKYPEDRKHIEEGRRWVRDAFYVQVSEPPQSRLAGESEE